MRHPVSPAEYDAMSARDRSRNVLSERPTQESYDAAMTQHSAAQAESAERAAVIASLEAVGGKYWSAEDGSKRRVYFEDFSNPHASGYVDLTTGQYVGKHSDFESIIKARM